MALTDYYVTDAGAGTADGSSIANAMAYSRFTDYMVTGGSFTAAPGDRFNIIGAITGRTTTTDTWVNGGSSTSPVVVRGWTSGGTTPYAGRTNGNGPLITTNFPTISYTTGRITITGTWIIVENLSISGATNNSVVNAGVDCLVTRCSITNSGTGASASTASGSTRSTFVDCDLSLSGASGGSSVVSVTGNGMVIDSCRITGVQAVPGILVSGTTFAILFGNTIYSSGGTGISLTVTGAFTYIRSNTIVGCAGDGIDVVTGATLLQRVIGNMITDNGGYAVDFNSAAVAGFVAYNRTRDNTSGAYNLATDWVTATSYGNVTTDTGGPSTDYVDDTTDDYNLIAASPATSASLPQYASMGALQRDQTGGGGGGGGMRLAGHGGLAA